MSCAQAGDERRPHTENTPCVMSFGYRFAYITYSWWGRGTNVISLPLEHSNCPAFRRHPTGRDEPLVGEEFDSLTEVSIWGADERGGGLR